MKKIIFLLGILFFMGNLFSIDLTGFGGIKTDDWKKLYGVALAWDMFPFIQLELEGFRLTSNSMNFISANPLLSLDLASFAPYITIGYGLSGEKSDISTYESFKNYGGGIKIFLGIIAIRIDYRVIKTNLSTGKEFTEGLTYLFERTFYKTAVRYELISHLKAPLTLIVAGTISNTAGR